VDDLARGQRLCCQTCWVGNVHPAEVLGASDQHEDMFELEDSLQKRASMTCGSRLQQVDDLARYFARIGVV
jgi:hypothetical protein